MDDRQRVRSLLAGVKCRDLDAVTTQILANPEMQTNFDGCCILYKDFIARNKAAGLRTFNVSETNSSRAGGDGDGGGSHLDLTYDQYKDAVIEDRYYDKSEYPGLSKPQKAKLKYLRDKRDKRNGGGGGNGKAHRGRGGRGGRNGRGGNSGGGGGAKHHLSQRSIQQISKAVAKIHKKSDSSLNDDMESMDLSGSEDEKPKANRDILKKAKIKQSKKKSGGG